MKDLTDREILLKLFDFSTQTKKQELKSDKDTFENFLNEQTLNKYNKTFLDDD